MAEELAPVAAPETPAPAEATDPEIPADDAPLSEHEAAFGPVDPSLEGEAKDKAEQTKQKIRHRARSQQAGPEDVPRIQKLTKEKRELEERLAALEARQQQATPPAREDRTRDTAAPPRSAEQGASSRPAVPETRPKPTEDEIGTKYPLHQDFVEDLYNWLDEQREARWQHDHQQRQQEAAQAEEFQAWQKANETFGTKLAEFKKTHPDYDALAAQHAQTQIPPLANKALLLHDNGPALVYHLFQHPELLAEMQFLMADRPLTEDYVAHATRWLSSRIPAGTTGSAVPTPPTVLAARPPNPVRTGPLKTGEELPGDDSSLAEHEHAFGKRRARR